MQSTKKSRTTLLVLTFNKYQEDCHTICSSRSWTKSTDEIAKSAIFDRLLPIHRITRYTVNHPYRKAFNVEFFNSGENIFWTDFKLIEFGQLLIVLSRQKYTKIFDIYYYLFSASNLDMYHHFGTYRNLTHYMQKSSLTAMD